MSRQIKKRRAQKPHLKFLNTQLRFSAYSLYSLRRFRVWLLDSPTTWIQLISPPKPTSPLWQIAQFENSIGHIDGDVGSGVSCLSRVYKAV